MVLRLTVNPLINTAYEYIFVSFDSSNHHRRGIEPVTNERDVK